MEISVVQNAIVGLEKILGKAKDALRQIEAEAYGYDEYIGYENPEGALGYFLDELGHTMTIVLEAAGMSEARSSLRDAWAQFKKRPKGLGGVIDDHNGNFESHPLTYAERVIKSLRMCVSAEATSEDEWTLRQLVRILKNTAVIVRRDGNVPSNELELQAVMHRYLRPVFVGFTTTIDISGTLKSFKPDCGIRPLGAAVEFKFVKAETEVALAFSGIAEDTAAYKGSKDWTKFYAVIYQAEPFMFEHDFEEDVRRIGAASWTPIIVNGKIKRRKLKKPPRSSLKK